ncbi:ABC transporter permease [Enterococcus sp. LJL98]
MNNPHVKRLLGGLAAILLFIGLWWLAAWQVNKVLLPSPFEVFARLPILFEKEIGRHLQVSGYRILLGMVYASGGGFLLGWLMGSFPKWRYFFDPMIYLTYPIPKMALLPIVMLLGGLGDTSKVMMIVLIVLPQVAISVRDAIRQIPENQYAVYRALKASRWQQFRQITFPATLPGILSGARISLGTAISILFFTENYGTQYGMGYFIMDAWTRMDYAAMYGGILLLSSFGLCLFLLLDFFSWWICRWERKA